MMRTLGHLATPLLLLCPLVARAAAPEVRGTWVTTTGINSSSSPIYNLAATTATFQQLRAIGLNSIYQDAWRAGYTYYPSPTLRSLIGVDRSPDLRNGRDLLQETVIQAHRNGMAVIPWFQYGFATYYGSATSPAANPLTTYMKNHGWLLQDAAGHYTNSSNAFSWMNPLVPEVQDFVIGLVTDAVRQYDLDGVQFDDRLAWPVQFGYDAYTRNAYKTETGRDLPADHNDALFKSWRASKVTAFAARLQAAVKAINPGAIVSVAPSVYPFGYDSYLANYPAWNTAGLFDEFVPQVYRRNATDFDGSWDGVGSITTRGQVQFFGDRSADFAAGIAIDGSGWTAPFSPNGIAEEVAQVRATPDVAGHVFWYANGVLNTYPAQLAGLYDVAHNGQAERPDRPAGYRPPSTVATPAAGANRWTATVPTAGLYSVVAYDGTAWTIFDTRYLTPGSPATFPIPGASRIELIADHRPASLFATTSWNLDADAPADAPASWSFDQVPAATALKFGYVITAPRTVTLNAPLAATSLTFDNVHRYTLAGPATLTLSTSISVVKGAHTISAPLAFASPVSLSIAAGASLDIAANTLSLSTPAATIRQYLHDARLTSSTLQPLHALGYLQNPDHSVTVQTTFIGDANLDGRLDADDYTLLDKGFASDGSFWWQGDFNYDGQIDQNDYLLIDTTLFHQAQGFSPGFLSMRESQFGEAYVSQLLTSVPEPCLSSILYLLSSLLLPRRRR